MLEILTKLAPLDRVSRVVDPSSFVASPGIWAAVQANGSVANCDAAAQKTLHKLVIGSASANIYESHDIEVGRCATLEHVFRASVDTDGFQETLGGTELTTAVSYVAGDELTVAHLTTSATNQTAITYCKAADLGKLRPILATSTQEQGKIVVARVESFDATNNVLTFNTVTPYPKVIDT